jgi:hypothetical protein
VQHKAELFVQNYSMSNLGVTTFAKNHVITNTWEEGKVDVADLFERQALEFASRPGAPGPVGPMLSVLEVRPPPPACACVGSAVVLSVLHCGVVCHVLQLRNAFV